MINQSPCNYGGRASFAPLVSRLMDLLGLEAFGLSGNLADFLVPRQALPEIAG